MTDAAHHHDPACATAHGDGPTPTSDDRDLVVVYATPLAAYLLGWGRQLGFTTTLLEPQRHRVTSDHRAAAGHVEHDPRAARPHPHSDVVVTDHGRGDLGPTMAPLVTAAPRSVGIIGSPRHAAPHAPALAEQGVDEQLIDTVQRPIGLDIGSRTPPEIAVAILGGLLAQHNGRSGRLPEPTAGATA